MKVCGKLSFNRIPEVVKRKNSDLSYCGEKFKRKEIVATVIKAQSTL